MDEKERDKILAAGPRKAAMEADFPGFPPESKVAMPDRMFKAADYSAYQLGQINRKLDQLIELLAKK